ncbi:MAG: response regulator transcription factor [Phycisphaerae bacterium]|nr:response regulator transcription factor [Phycisphaerae bacterium]
MQQITVLLADDHTIVRQGLLALLEAESDITVVGEADNGHQAVSLTKKLRPEVVVMDIAMPRLNGMEATRQIVKLLPATKVLILSAHSDDEYIEQVIRAGAAGYLIKQTSALVLSKAIREVHQGKPFFSPSIASRLSELYPDLPDQGTGIKRRRPTLTSREMEVLQLVAEGKANKQVAKALDISIKTVEKHRQHLMKKLGLHDTAGLTRYAIGAGIIENRVQVTTHRESGSGSKDPS